MMRQQSLARLTEERCRVIHRREAFREGLVCCQSCGDEIDRSQASYCIRIPDVGAPAAEYRCEACLAHDCRGEWYA